MLTSLVLCCATYHECPTQLVQPACKREHQQWKQDCSPPRYLIWHGAWKKTYKRTRL